MHAFDKCDHRFEIFHADDEQLECEETHFMHDFECENTVFNADLVDIDAETIDHREKQQQQVSRFLR